MMLSAFAILIFHLWVNLSYPMSRAEGFLTKTTYWGVDIFFFLSAYSIGGRKVEKYGSFILGRIKQVYVKYIIFAIIACIYAKWPLIRLFKVIFAVEFFEKGGGSFLWFLPGIMLVYIFLPIYQKLDVKNRKLTLLSAVAVWLLVAFLFTYCTKYHTLFIFWNRVPIILTGFYLGQSEKFKSLLNRKMARVLTGAGLLIIGYVLLYYFGYRPQLQTPIKDMFYLMAIPADLGIILLVGMIPELKVIRWIGNATLEMYALQMIFGYRIMNILIKTDINAMLINICTMIIIILPAIVFSYFYRKCLRVVSREK